MSWVDVDGVGQESKQVPIGVSLSTTDNFVCDISVDSSGYPHIVYEGLTGTTTNIYYIQWNGTSWVDADGTGQESSNISNTTTACTFPTLKLDPIRQAACGLDREQHGSLPAMERYNLDRRRRNRPGINDS